MRKIVAARGFGAIDGSNCLNANLTFLMIH